jgi:DNA-binding FadR family transcriptional regulator
MKFESLHRPRAFEEILGQVEQAIAQGQLGPGDRLPPERELAETFGVSRSSVREALRVLEMFGVVVARRGAGNEAGSIVADGNANGLVMALGLHSALLRIPPRDLVDVRVLIESYAAGRAATRSSPDGVRKLEKLIENMEASTSPDSFYELDTDFHVALGELSGNVLLPVLMEALRGSMQREMLAGYGRLDDWDTVREQLIAEHREILDAIGKADTDRAEAILRSHILRFYREVLSSDD